MSYRTKHKKKYTNMWSNRVCSAQILITKAIAKRNDGYFLNSSGFEVIARIGMCNIALIILLSKLIFYLSIW